jgi:hypothetical protein
LVSTPVARTPASGIFALAPPDLVVGFPGVRHEAIGPVVLSLLLRSAGSFAVFSP